MKASAPHWVHKLRALLDSASPTAPIIDLSVGQPDGPPPAAVLTAISQSFDSLHAYPEPFGSPALRAAIAAWLRARLSIDFAAHEIAVTHGAKLAVAMAIPAYTELGDRVLVPTPGYPTYAAAALQAGREVVWLRLHSGDAYEPTRSALEQGLTGSRLAYLNYPSNPTGARGSVRAFADAVEVARQTGAVLVHDAAYAELVHEGRALSVFQVPGADEVAIEVHSFSKAFHLCGWRVGFAVGRKHLMDPFRRALTLCDSGAARPAQTAALAAVTTAPDFPEARRARDRARTHRLARNLSDLGCRLTPPNASFYLWFHPPEGRPERGWEAVVGEAGIACAPGDDFGPEGAGWIRFACVQPDSVYDEVAARLSRLWR